MGRRSPLYGVKLHITNPRHEKCNGCGRCYTCGSFQCGANRNKKLCKLCKKDEAKNGK